MTYYPERECSLAPLRPSHAPADGCECEVCARLRRNRAANERPRLVPVVLSRDPYHGELRPDG